MEVSAFLIIFFSSSIQRFIFRKILRFIPGFGILSECCIFDLENWDLCLEAPYTVLNLNQTLLFS